MPNTGCWPEPRLTCGGYIVRLDALHRNDLYTRLAYDRLERKYDVVRELFAESDSNWNQTFYVLLFRTIGDVTNRDAFLTLARRVSYRMVLRERASLHAVEAMLIGASGLLDNYRDDAYTRSLKQDFDYFSPQIRNRTDDGRRMESPRHPAGQSPAAAHRPAGSVPSHRTIS